MIIDLSNPSNKIHLPRGRSRVLVIGDLNVDMIFQDIKIGLTCPSFPEKNVGGTGVNASIAFKNNEFDPLVFGKIGKDSYGRMIIEKLESEKIVSMIEIDEKKPTCLCNIIYFKNCDSKRTIFYDNNNANDYDINNLRKALDLIQLEESDYIFLTLYLISQVNFDLNYCREFCNTLSSTNAKIIIDFVPHDLYNFCSAEELNFVLPKKIFAIVAEYRTFMKLFDLKHESSDNDNPTEYDYLILSNNFSAQYYICRHGEGCISRQTIFSLDNGILNYIERDFDTGYSSKLEAKSKRGFGDLLTSRTLKKINDIEEKSYNH